MQGAIFLQSACNPLASGRRYPGLDGGRWTMQSERAGRHLCGVLCAGIAAAISVAFVSFALAAVGVCVGCVAGFLGAL